MSEVWHISYGLFYTYDTMVMVFYQFEPIWVSLHSTYKVRSRSGKKGKILKFLIKNKDMILMHNVPRNPMVPLVFSLRWLELPKIVFY